MPDGRTFPPGTAVRHRDGRLGEVVRQDDREPVMVIRTIDGSPPVTVVGRATWDWTDRVLDPPVKHE